MDLSFELDVEIVDGSLRRSFDRWPVGQVMEHLARKDGNVCIVCPRVPPESGLYDEAFIQDAAGQQLSLPGARADSCGVVLLEKGAFLDTTWSEFERLVCVTGGQVMVMFATSSKEDVAANLHTAELKGVVLKRDQNIWLPPYTLFKIVGLESSMLVTANIGPRLWTTKTCETCKAIPFLKLPSEEEPAYAHKASLGDLSTSSETCGLCRKILDALQSAANTYANDEAPARAAERRYPPGTAGADRSGHGKFAVQFRVSEIEGLEITQVALRSSRPHLFAETGAAKKPMEPNLPLLVPQDKVLNEGGSVRPWLYGNWWTIAGRRACPPQLIGIGVRATCRPTITPMPEASRKACVTYRGSDIRVLTKQIGALSNIIPGRITDPDSRSDLTLKLLNTFLCHCSRSHKCEPLGVELPTRVLDLKNARGGEVKLVETRGRKGKYIALSYCWGQSTPLKTTRTTLEEHKKGIGPEKLPRTLRDAVEVSLRLDVRYLWIDSLCIIQGDPDDWLREGLKMSDVYSNAWLTVAASASKESSGGLFPFRKSPPYTSPESKSTGFESTRGQGVVVPLGGGASGEPTDSLYLSTEWMPPTFTANPRLYQVGSFGPYIDPVCDEPLNKRGWTLQERYLSPRVVHIASDQVYFECTEGIIAEDGARFMNIYSKDSMVRYQTQPGDGLFGRERYRFDRGWSSVVMEYSRRDMTYEADKLPALAGLSSWIAERTRDQYLAGVWREHVFQDILWRTYPQEEDPPIWGPEGLDQKIEHGPFSPLRRSAAYRAPSWSWAALDGPIKFQYIKSSDICARFRGGHVESTTGSPFGAVRSGWLKIEGPLFELEEPKESISIPPRTVVQYTHEGQAENGYVAFDIAAHFPCFALFVTSEWALILRRSGSSNACFERVGVGRFWHPAAKVLNDDGSEQTVDQRHNSTYLANWEEVTII